MGSAIALSDNLFKPEILILSLTTAILLQILSNLANDYGDSKKGTDNINRVGPERAVQSGIISPIQMKRMTWIFIFLSLISGVLLIYVGLKDLDIKYGIIFFVIGLGAILAAIRYTIGKNPYGYIGFGDIFVFIFFGLTGVLGSYFLHANSLSWDLLLPASSVGLLSSGVLNLNNMRDIVNDKLSGKKTIVVMMGGKMAKYYHFFLISTALILILIYVLLNLTFYGQLFILVIYPFFIKDLVTIYNNNNPVDLDPELKKLAISTLTLSILFGIIYNM